MSDAARFGRYSAGEVLGARDDATFWRAVDPSDPSRCLVAVVFSAADDGARAGLFARGESARAAASSGDRVLEVGRDASGRVFATIELVAAALSPQQCVARASALLAAAGLTSPSAEETWLARVDAETLYAEAILADAPDTDALVAYASDRASLGADQVAAIEAYLAASPFHQARLTQLERRLDPVVLARGAALARERWAEAAIAAPAGAESAARALEPWRRVTWILGGAIAVLALLVLLRWLA